MKGKIHIVVNQEIDNSIEKATSKKSIRLRRQSWKLNLVSSMVLIACPGDDIVPLAMKFLNPASESTLSNNEILEDILSMMWVQKHRDDKKVSIS